MHSLSVHSLCALLEASDLAHAADGAAVGQCGCSGGCPCATCNLLAASLAGPDAHSLALHGSLWRMRHTEGRRRAKEEKQQEHWSESSHWERIMSCYVMGTITSSRHANAYEK